MKSSKWEKIVSFIGISFFIMIIVSSFIIKLRKDNNSKVEENIIETDYNTYNELEESTKKEKVYGYTFEIGAHSSNPLVSEEIKIDYNKQVEDINKVKDVVLQELKNNKEIRLEGISYLYFNEQSKIYVVMVQIGPDNNHQFYACYKNIENFELKKLTNFYYAGNMLNIDNGNEEPKEFEALSKNSSEFRDKTKIYFHTEKNKGYMQSFTNSLYCLFFKENYEINNGRLIEGCNLIRNVENEFLIDNE